MKLFLKHATDKVCVFRAVKVALVVGTILALINHYDAIFTFSIEATNVFQIILTYLVPYCVATFGSAMQARHLECEAMKACEGPSSGGKRSGRPKNKE